MFVRLENTPRDYAWGSTTAIAELLGTTPSGQPEAELWFGTHPGSPTRIVNPDQVGGYTTLEHWVAAEPAVALGAGSTHLPFLLKLLAADHPLSLQTHPSRAQAVEGFAREDAAGIALSSPTRNYKDRNHKPELIVALSPTFDALCGFRPASEVLRILKTFVDAAQATALLSPALDAFIAEFEQRSDHGKHDEPAIEWALAWLLGGLDGGTAEGAVGAQPSRPGAASEPVGVQGLVAEISALAATGDNADAVTVRELMGEYPNDPGIVLALLLNRVRLVRGQALFLPAGNMHAYLHGFGVELMASSDNVLRGGLTPKHVDVAELLAVTQCVPLPIPFLIPQELAAGVTLFSAGVEDFQLHHVVVNAQINGGQAHLDVAGPAILLCIAGLVSVTGGSSSCELTQGQAAFVTPDEGPLTASGTGEFFIASRG